MPQSAMPELDEVFASAAETTGDNGRLDLQPVVGAERSVADAERAAGRDVGFEAGHKGRDCRKLARIRQGEPRREIYDLGFVISDLVNGDLVLTSEIINPKS